MSIARTRLEHIWLRGENVADFSEQDVRRVLTDLDIQYAIDDGGPGCTIPGWAVPDAHTGYIQSECKLVGEASGMFGPAGLVGRQQRYSIHECQRGD